MTGIALVGVSTVAVAPIIATPPDVEITNQHVQLSASPFDKYLEAIERAIESAQLLLLHAVTDPALPPNVSLEDIVAGSGDGDGNVDRLMSLLETVPGRPELQAWIDGARASVPVAIEFAAAGNIDDAVNTLILGVTSLLNATNLVLVLASGVASSALGAGGVVTQDLLEALGSGNPADALTVLARTPAVVAEGLFRPNQQPGPASLAIGLTQVLRGAVSPQPQVSTSYSAPANQRTVTFDVNAAPSPQAIEGIQVAEDPTEVQHPDEKTNKNVMADDGGTGPADGDKHGPRPLGGHSASQSGSGAGLSAVRDGIRDGVQGFRDGVRNAVKTLTGHGGDDSHGTIDNTGEPS